MPREKIALVVFIGLIAVSLCGLFGYLTIGHSWNVAASNIDDATGRMDGYTVIVYEGTVNPEPTGQKAGKELGGSRSAASGAQGSGEADRTGGNVEAKPSEPGHSADADGEERDLSGISEQDPVSDPDQLSDSAASTDGSLEDGAPIDIDEVEQSYLDKNATVFVIDSADLELYREGTILKKGGHRFGIFSVSPRTTAKTVGAQVEYFQSHDVDFIVALTPDKRIVEDASGIDIVISTKDEGLFVMGETIDGTFYVNAPQIGSAGVILISPSNVVSAKVVQSN